MTSALRSLRKYWTELRKKGGSKKQADNSVAGKVEQIQRRIVELQVPSKQEVDKALVKASPEVQHVFQILGVNTKTFVLLVLEAHFETIQDIVQYGVNHLWKLTLKGIRQSFVERLMYFFEWLERFESSNDRTANLLEDFSKEVFKEFEKTDPRASDAIPFRREQPKRSCKNVRDQCDPWIEDMVNLAEKQQKHLK